MGEAANHLAGLRLEIDDIDHQLLALLKRRFDICQRIAEHKIKHQIPMMQTDRVAEIKDRAEREALASGISPVFARKIWEMIVAEACRLERDHGCV